MKKPRTRKDLETDPRVEELWKESDGWWCYLKPGFAFDGERSGNAEETIRYMCMAFETIVEVPVVDGKNVYRQDARP